MRVHINWRDEPKDDDPASLPWPSSSRNPAIILPRPAQKTGTTNGSTARETEEPTQEDGAGVV